MAIVRQPMLAPIAATVRTDGTSLEKPSLYFIPIAHATSNTPAINTKNQAIKPPYKPRASSVDLRVPTKPAMHSNLKPAGYSDRKPATLGVNRMGRFDDVVGG